jgi:hypothetical protein
MLKGPDFPELLEKSEDYRMLRRAYAYLQLELQSAGNSTQLSETLGYLIQKVYEQNEELAQLRGEKHEFED